MRSHRAVALAALLASSCGGAVASVPGSSAPAPAAQAESNEELDAPPYVAAMLERFEATLHTTPTPQGSFALTRGEDPSRGARPDRVDGARGQRLLSRMELLPRRAT